LSFWASGTLKFKDKTLEQGKLEVVQRQLWQSEAATRLPSGGPSGSKLTGTID